MGDPLTMAIVGSAILGTGASVYQGQQQSKSAKKASSRQQALIDAQAQAGIDAKKKAVKTQRASSALQTDTVQTTALGAGAATTQKKTLLGG